MINDRSKTTIDVEVKDGERVEKTERSYRRTVALTPEADARLPEIFMDRWGGKDVGAQLEFLRIEFWYRPNHRGELVWKTTEIRLNGHFLKKDGTPGERAAYRLYMDIKPEDAKGDGWYSDHVPPQWLQEILDEVRPTGAANPFSIEIVEETTTN